MRNGKRFLLLSIAAKNVKTLNLIYYGAVKEGKSRNIAKIAKAVL